MLPYIILLQLLAQASSKDNAREATEPGKSVCIAHAPKCYYSAKTKTNGEDTPSLPMARTQHGEWQSTGYKVSQIGEGESATGHSRRWEQLFSRIG